MEFKISEEFIDEFVCEILADPDNYEHFFNEFTFEAIKLEFQLFWYGEKWGKEPAIQSSK